MILYHLDIKLFIIYSKYKMDETYCIKDKRLTPCVEPSGYQTDKNGRKQFYCHCAVCGIKKVRYVKNNVSGEKKA